MYPVHRSPLYKLGNKRKLAFLLGLPPGNLARLISDDSYDVFLSGKKGKEREIQTPKPKLKKIHKKLHKLLARIETPDYLISGKKGQSHLANAPVHCRGKFLLNVDIQSFYRSGRREYIFKTFHRTFRMSEDVAWLLTDLAVYKNFIPTGSPASQIMAYWAYEPTFSRIKRLADKHSLRMTIFVDDLTFSGTTPIPHWFPNAINYELNKADLKIKKRKTKFFSSREFKVVTGCAISPDGDLKIPNKLRKKIVDSLRGRSIRDLSMQELSSLAGMLSAARQIEPSFFEQVNNTSKELLRKQKERLSA